MNVKVKEKEIIVNLEVKPVSVSLTVADNLTDREILALAKAAYIEKISKEFPHVKYSVNDASQGVLTFDNVFVGKVVKDKGRGSIGVVIKINQKTISVALSNSQRTPMIVNGHPLCFVPVEDDTDFEGLLNKGTPGTHWFEGESGYLANKKDKSVHHVVVTKITPAGNHQLYVVNEKRNNYWSLSVTQMTALMFDNREAAENFIK